MTYGVYIGPWINHSNGLVKGATITLEQREGGLLTAFLAAFVTFVGNRLFKVICYISHQVQSKNDFQDGLYHQQQVILRSSPTPPEAVWSFLQQLLPWRKRAPRALLRILPWVVFGLLYIVAMVVATLFSSQISKAPGSLRLVASDTCGTWTLDGDSTFRSEAFSKKTTGDRSNNTKLCVPLLR